MRIALGRQPASVRFGEYYRFALERPANSRLFMVPSVSSRSVAKLLTRIFSGISNQFLENSRFPGDRLGRRGSICTVWRCSQSGRMETLSRGWIRANIISEVNQDVTARKSYMYPNRCCHDQVQPSPMSSGPRRMLSSRSVVEDRPHSQPIVATMAAKFDIVTMRSRSVLKDGNELMLAAIE